MDQKVLFMTTIADGRNMGSLTNWWKYVWKIIIASKVFIFYGNLWTALWFRHLFAQKKDAAEGLGANPTDRGRSGTKIHLHVDQKGTPLGIIVVGANVHDSRLVGLTIENNSDLVSVFNVCTDNHHFCLDKGYDYPRVHEEVYAYGFEAHIRSRGEEKVEKQEGLHPARRWVVERTFAWLKGFRGIRTRYCRYLSTFISFVKLACAIIVFRKIYTEQ